MPLKAMRNLMPILLVVVAGCGRVEPSPSTPDVASTAEQNQAAADQALSVMLDGIALAHDQKMNSGPIPKYFPGSDVLAPIVTHLIETVPDFADMNRNIEGYKIYEVPNGWMQAVDYREKGNYGFPQKVTGYFIAGPGFNARRIGSVEHDQLKQFSTGAERDRLNAIEGAKATIRKNFPGARIR
jgi:hypothetical protein